MARYIDADAFEVVSLKDVSDEFALGVQYAMELLDKAPTIEARPVVRGEWIEKPHTDGFGGHYFLYHCSRCDTPYAKKRNFCNECGAEMRGEEDG